ncbi:pentatricopeptide repeat-containing protein At3g46870 isoform X2 [Amborella trichopoda]|uniref:pentatricopeptide repeat-containing protein At3g46870 isoform X2 n=1 Tax=Amborella trichopoda TaxID=13333 RepID=UPI0009C0793A|nr:pentatricopeptide repeat-containing protein At3g46870 isoform X2 [Amborella trichopoda]|eukprot:XP_020526494.1 pentatricopeptide repeat-containing protein At3g46870 isoform X2 [Amborella trichopoda]
MSYCLPPLKSQVKTLDFYAQHRLCKLSIPVYQKRVDSLDFHGGYRFLEVPGGASEKLQFLGFRFKQAVHFMRDRSKNRKPLQKGRNLSIEGIQTVQALKRAKKDEDSLRKVFVTKVFEDVRKEYWYKPQVSLYADMIAVLARNGSFEKVKLLFSDLKMEILEGDIEGFNGLLRTFIEFGMAGAATECYHLMRKVQCEPDKSTFMILINGLESLGNFDFASKLRSEAEKYFGDLEFFLEENEGTAMALTRS